MVSVIIPCYNHGHYLPEAIESVLGQTYGQVEVVVVDDGSTDNTREAAARYPQVRYVHQHNQGLSATRNTGVRHSRGELLVFLDADDWLYPQALETNVRYLLQHEDAAFVSGAFARVLVEENLTREEAREIKSDHYWHLLRGNYIGMPAVMMYRRWAFNEFLFDVSAPDSCGDYDLSLRVARKYPVVHHTEKVAAYRIHASNMSSNIPVMLSSTLKVLKRQEAELKTEQEKKAYAKGKIIWTDYYCNELYQKLRSGKAAVNKASLEC